MIRKIALLFVLLFSQSSHAQGGAKACDDAKENIKTDKLLGIRPPPLGNGLAPFTDNTPYGNIPTFQNYRANAGYYCDSQSNLPTLYAHLTGFTVVSIGYERTYGPDQINEALNDYKRILKLLDYSNWQKRK